MKKGWQIALAVAILAAAAFTPVLAEEPIARTSYGAASVAWAPGVENEGFTLTVTGPERFRLQREFKAGEALSFDAVDAKGNRLPDGSYSWELRANPVVSKDVRSRLKEARDADGRGEEVELELWRAGLIPREDLTLSGTFTISGGVLVPEDLTEGRKARQRQNTKAGSGLTPTTAADQVIPDDLIVQQSLCVGFDCVNGESFGFDTIRLKENNTRIKFEDTSTGTFPSNDWQLTANDSASGGQNKFSIEDITGAKVPFTIEGGATTNSVYVDSTGRVGFRTSTPVLDLHIATSNTPGIRLEQNSSGGFTAQTWDIAGNEANFFVRDVTGGSRLPFRIRPGAPTSSVDIAADGDVGIGTASPAVRLDVKTDSATTGLVRLQSTSATGFPGIEFFNESGTQIGYFGGENFGDTIRFNAIANHPLLFLTNSVEHIRVTSAGNVGIGTTTPGGKLDVNGSIFQRGAVLHADYVFEPDYKLESIAENAAAMWKNKHLPAIGPRKVDEEGREVIELGADRRGIVEELEKAHIYIAQLDEQLRAKDEKLTKVEQLNLELAERLARIEALLQEKGETQN